MAENKDTDLLNDLEKQEYKYGFTTDIETETIPRGLDEGVDRKSTRLNSSHRT